MQSPPSLLDQALDRVFDDAHERFELGLRAVEVVGRQKPQGHDFHARFIAPTQELHDLGRTRTMPHRGGRTLSRGPPSVAVQDYAYVAGPTTFGDLRHDLTLIGAIDQIAKSHEVHATPRTHPCGPR